MRVEKIIDNTIWDAWQNTNCVHASFTQSFAWGDILISEGKKVERLAVVEGETWLLAAQVVYEKLPFGNNYAFCPKGPVVPKTKGAVDALTLEELKKYLTATGALFLRIEPEQALPPSFTDWQQSIDVNPRATSVLDLHQMEPELLAHMHAKTRYNINLAQKKNVRITTDKHFDVFWKLMKETGQRDHFSLHKEAHYRAIFASPLVQQYTAWIGEAPAATAVAAAYGDTFTYVFGASSYDLRKYMAPQLLQFEMIKAAKAQGYGWYDFFGIAPRANQEPSEYVYDEKHQYAGVTRFKLGFGGITVASPGTLDLPMQAKKYMVYRLFRFLRRLV